MNKPDDTELERYLAGEHPLSTQYRKTANEQPPAELDNAIRQQAHDAAPARQRRWLRPLAAAAVFILGVGMVFELQHHPAVQPAATSATANPAGRTDFKALQDNPEPVRARKQPQPMSAPSRSVSPQLESLAMPDVRRPAATRKPAQPAPGAQIDHIQQLLEAGKHDAAIKALEQLLKTHPGYPLPDALAHLAESEQLSAESE